MEWKRRRTQLFVGRFGELRFGRSTGRARLRADVERWGWQGHRYAEGPAGRVHRRDDGGCHIAGPGPLRGKRYDRARPDHKGAPIETDARPPWPSERHTARR